MAMGELTVGVVMIPTPITVRCDTVFKDAVCALLASDYGAVPVIDADQRPVGTVSESVLLANVEFHGGNDPRPILGGSAARRRWRLAGTLAVGELMTSPAVVVYPGARLSEAARRLAESAQPLLCVVDAEMRLVGVLTARELLSVYQRSDNSIAADIHAVLDPLLDRPTRTPAPVEVQVCHGVVGLAGTLLLRSRTDRAAAAVARIPGVVAVHNDLRYELDDLAFTGF